MLPSGNFWVRECPGPADVNWPALWTTWQARWRRAALLILPLAGVMLFPIGVITGALSNLTTAVCGGTPGARAASACEGCGAPPACEALRARSHSAHWCPEQQAALSPRCMDPSLRRHPSQRRPRPHALRLATPTAETNSLYWPWFCDASDGW